MKAIKLSIFRYIVVASLLMLLAPMTVHAQSAGNVNWEGWTLDYEVSSRFDGISLSNVSYQGVKVLERASMPVMTVFYENNACGPYADRLGGTGLPVDWAGNSSVVNRTFTQNGETWREIGFQDKIGAYILYQVWYLSGSGQIEAHIFAKGLQCQTDHLHYPFWRLDFDLSGTGDDQIRRHTGTAWEVYSNEFDAAATTANNHQWQVRDLGNGMTVDIAFDTNTWNVPGTVIPETMYANNQVYGRLYQSSEAGGWTDGAITSVQGNNGEDINGRDNVFWYRGYLPHLASEGGELWHSTGIRLTVSLPGGPGGNNPPTITSPGDQTYTEGDTVSLPIIASDPDGDTLTYSASGLPTGLSINSGTGVISGTLSSGSAGQHAATITVIDGRGGSANTNSFTWTIQASGGAVCATTSSTDVPKNIIDNQTSSSTLLVETVGAVTDVNVVDLQGTHTYMNDLTFTLTSPSGSTVEIIERRCGSTNDFSLSLDDAANGAMPCPPVGGGTYQPTNALSSFNGTNGNGAWTLQVTDHANRDTGTLQGWGLEVCAATGGGGNIAPNLTNPGDQTHTEGDSINFTIDASDPDNDPLTFTATGLPPGLGINELNGIITGIVDTQGSYNVTLLVDDGRGGTTSVSFAWTINAAPGLDDILYVSSTSGGSVGGVSFADEDILAFNRTTNTWSKYFDGSDVGLSGSSARDVNAFHVLNDGTILLSFIGETTIPDVGSVDDSDIVRFIPTSLGTTTSGRFELYFDGSDVGLTTSAEDIDALHLLSDGRLILSTIGSSNVIGTTWRDEDLLVFNPTSLGTNTSGAWALYFDGSDVGLAESRYEDIYGVWLDDNGDIYLSTRGSFSVPGVSGDGADVLRCVPSSLGTTTSCSFSLNWDGSTNSYGGERLDGLSMSQP